MRWRRAACRLCSARACGAAWPVAPCCRSASAPPGRAGGGRPEWLECGVGAWAWGGSIGQWQIDNTCMCMLNIYTCIGPLHFYPRTFCSNIPNSSFSLGLPLASTRAFSGPKSNVFKGGTEAGRSGGGGCGRPLPSSVVAVGAAVAVGASRTRRRRGRSGGSRDDKGRRGMAGGV